MTHLTKATEIDGTRYRGSVLKQKLSQNILVTSDTFCLAFCSILRAYVTLS